MNHRIILKLGLTQSPCQRELATHTLNAANRNWLKINHGKLPLPLIETMLRNSSLRKRQFVALA